jgi:D-serine deaminase-like pyridoxal phosphate-dependent protein
LFADHLEGVTEVRAGTYMFFDLVQAGMGVCSIDEIALSVLTTVIGHQEERGWIIVDAGWMALSRDRGTEVQSVDWGYGRVCDTEGVPLAGLLVAKTSQEHGIIFDRYGANPDPADFPVGTLLRVLPNHACATAAQHDCYNLVQSGSPAIAEIWPRFGGW